ncbi:MAG: hypothetical protein P8X74_09255 [Reinekea sp.]|jgi:hypothetical protein
MGAPAIFEKQIRIKLLHPASTEGVTDSGLINWIAAIAAEVTRDTHNLFCQYPAGDRSCPFQFLSFIIVF